LACRQYEGSSRKVLDGESTNPQKRHALGIEDFRFEMMHAGSIYENQIETFLEVKKLRIESSNRNLAKRTFASSYSVVAFKKSENALSIRSQDLRLKSSITSRWLRQIDQVVHFSKTATSCPRFAFTHLSHAATACSIVLPISCKIFCSLKRFLSRASRTQRDHDSYIASFIVPQNRRRKYPDYFQNPFFVFWDNPG